RIVPPRLRISSFLSRSEHENGKSRGSPCARMTIPGSQKKLLPVVAIPRGVDNLDAGLLLWPQVDCTVSWTDPRVVSHWMMIRPFSQLKSRCVAACQAEPRGSPRPSSFNPLPGSSPGRTAEVGDILQRLEGVSIRSRVHHPGERENILEEILGRYEVSIRSRVHHPGERIAMRGYIDAGVFQSAPGFITRENARVAGALSDDRRFQSAPGFITRENTHLRRNTPASPSGFNPLPGSSPGRTCPPRSGRRVRSRFNPLPGSSPGRTGGTPEELASLAKVSIRSRVHHPGEPAAARRARCASYRCPSAPRVIT